MKNPTHNDRSVRILSYLVDWGLPFEAQQRLAAFAVVWGAFESQLESTIWALRGDKVAGVRPWTDTTSISAWIEALEQGSKHLPPAANDVLCVVADAAKNLLNYRHAIMHGIIIHFPETAAFIRNPLWGGVERKRPTHVAHVDVNLLDMAIDSAWVLCRVVNSAQTACTEPDKVMQLAALKSEVARARSQSNELRYLTELMNNEKY